MNHPLFIKYVSRVSSECLQLLAADKRFLGGRSVMKDELHTWTQTLEYHPHIHYIIPGIAYDSEKQTLRFARQGFLVHVKALSRMFRFRFKKALQKVGLMENIPADIFNKEWVVHGQSVGNGLPAFKYLAQYVYRIAISNQRLLSCKNGQVRFSYKDHHRDIYKTMALPALEFIRRFCQHILPKGFQKVRYYGFLHPKRVKLFKQMQLLLNVRFKTTKNNFNENNLMFCPDCGRPMVCIACKTVCRPPPLHELVKLFVA